MNSMWILVLCYISSVLKHCIWNTLPIIKDHYLVALENLLLLCPEDITCITCELFLCGIYTCASRICEIFFVIWEKTMCYCPRQRTCREFHSWFFYSCRTLRVRHFIAHVSVHGKRKQTLNNIRQVWLCMISGRILLAMFLNGDTYLEENIHWDKLVKIRMCKRDRKERSAWLKHNHDCDWMGVGFFFPLAAVGRVLEEESGMTGASIKNERNLGGRGNKDKWNGHIVLKNHRDAAIDLQSIAL